MGRQQFLVGIDIGTTGAKAIVMGIEGKILGSGYHEYTCEYPKPNWVEQDVDMIVGKSMEATKDAVTRSGIDPKEVSGISFSTQRCCTICIDREGKLVRPMISWQDNRTSAELAEIRDAISDKEFYSITSFPQSTTWMLSKILWLRKNEPENWSQTAKVVQLHDYTAKAWGAEEYIVDYPDAVFFGLWNPVKMEWNQRLMDIAGVTEDMLPKPMPSSSRMGTLSVEAAEKTGLLAGTPLCVGAGDQNAAAVGAGIVVPGALSVSLGTAGLAAAYVDKPYEDPSCLTMVTNHAIEGAWQVEGYQAGAGSVLRWFRDEIARSESQAAQIVGADVYHVINKMISDVPAGSKGLVLMPYWASATTPRWDSQARGAIMGLTFAHDRKCLARAFMEGIILEVNDMINALMKSGVEVSDIHILGGATKSTTWNQIQADVYNRAVKTLENSDAAPLGAAILAGAGVGVFESIKAGSRKCVKLKDTCEPIAENAKVYAELYDIYCLMYEAFKEKGVYEKIAAYQEANC